MEKLLNPYKLSAIVFACLALAPCFLTGCKSANRTAQTPEPQKTESQEAVQKEDAQKVSLYFHAVWAYCGGAAPTEEMEIERQKGAPFAGSVWYIGRDLKSAVSVKADEVGWAHLPLKKGTYQVFADFKGDASMLQQWRKTWKFNEDCLQQLLAKPDFTFEVSDANRKFEFTFYKRCSYEGPIPCVTNPQAPPP
jgi:hypothetical protein